MREAALALLLLGTILAIPAILAGTGAGQPETAQAPPDPETDVIGWENGVWYNESIPVDQTGLERGLTDREVELLSARTMARVEELRGLEFEGNVTLEFISRQTFKERLRSGTLGEPRNPQVYEAMFAFGERENTSRAIQRWLGGAVVGYAAEEGAKNLTIITRSSSLRAVSASVLAHEFVHVLQHQHFDLSAPRYQRQTLDGVWAKDGLVEGEASYIDSQYSRQCISNWSCVNAPANWSGAHVPTAPVFGLLSSQPYADGGTFVYNLYQRGGWDAVTAAHERPPTTTEQIIHLDRSRKPVPLSVSDHSTDAWRLTHEDRLGEVGIFAMFYGQQLQAPEGKEVLDRDIFERQHRWDVLNFSFGPSAGWGNDRFMAYRRGERGGYVWTSVWDSEREAREFAGAYRRALIGMGAWRYGNHTYKLDEGPFADAFYVIRRGTRVKIVNAPTVEALSAIDQRVTVEPNPHIERLQARLEARNETIAALRDRLAARNETIEGLRDRLSARNRTVERLRERLEAKNESLARLQQRLTARDDTDVRTPFTPALVVIAGLLVAGLLRWRSGAS
ncbi:MAG: Hvo_1808 family surface protein [Halodesulfurarchaeum sp.]